MKAFTAAALVCISVAHPHHGKHGKHGHGKHHEEKHNLFDKISHEVHEFAEEVHDAFEVVHDKAEKYYSLFDELRDRIKEEEVVYD